jgi:hypothetical protein
VAGDLARVGDHVGAWAIARMFPGSQALGMLGAVMFTPRGDGAR